MSKEEIKYTGPTWDERITAHFRGWFWAIGIIVTLSSGFNLIFGVLFGFLAGGISCVFRLIYCPLSQKLYEKQWIKNEIKKKEEAKRKLEEQERILAEEERRKIEEEKIRIQKENERKENMFNGKERIFINTSTSIQFNKKMIRINKEVYDLDNVKYYLGGKFIKGTISHYSTTSDVLLGRTTYNNEDKYNRDVQYYKNNYTYGLKWKATPIYEYYFCIKKKDGTCYTNYQCNKDQAEKTVEELNSYKEWISKNKI